MGEPQPGPHGNQHQAAATGAGPGNELNTRARPDKELGPHEKVVGEPHPRPHDSLRHVAETGAGPDNELGSQTGAGPDKEPSQEEPHEPEVKLQISMQTTVEQQQNALHLEPGIMPINRPLRW